MGQVKRPFLILSKWALEAGVGPPHYIWHVPVIPQPWAATPSVSSPRPRSSPSCWSAVPTSRPLTTKTTTPSTRPPATSLQSPTWSPPCSTPGPTWTLLMAKAAPLVNSLEARLYMRLLPCSNIVICNVWPLGLFGNKAFLIEARYRPSCLILLICIDIAINRRKQLKIICLPCCLKLIFQPPSKKYFGKKKRLVSFFLLNPTKPEPYDHGMKENNEHL